MRSGLRLCAAAVSVLSALAAPASGAEAPKRGGTLTFMIPADAPPSFDGHQEGTFAMLHATAPFYSTLARINPENASSTTDFMCDLCTEMPQPTDDGKTFTFKLRQGVKFHDGTPLTSADVKASWDSIIHPQEGVLSPRESYYMMVDKVEAPDPATIVFRLKFATSTFLPALADPFTFIYQKAKLDKDPHWYEKNILGSGPFKFVSYETGQSITGVGNPDSSTPRFPLSRRLHRDLCREAGDPARRDPQRPRRRRIPRPAAFGARRIESRARRQDHGAGERLEQREPGEAAPRQAAVRRRPGAPRPDPGGRSLARRAGAL